jgi:hypothetical protein
VTLIKNVVTYNTEIGITAVKSFTVQVLELSISLLSGVFDLEATL